MSEPFIRVYTCAVIDSPCQDPRSGRIKRYVVADTPEEALRLYRDKIASDCGEIDVVPEKTKLPTETRGHVYTEEEFIGKWRMVDV